MNSTNIYKVAGIVITVLTILTSAVFFFGNLANQVVNNRCAVETSNALLHSISADQAVIQTDIAVLQTDVKYIKDAVMYKSSLVSNY